MSATSTSLSLGIVGLPNVGKSTLFNALLRRQVALSANYPFATIEPNVGVVPVPDSRLDSLADLANLEFGFPVASVVPATVKFVDIAGLVKGASKGEGLGNKFLSHIREADAIIHVVRLFEDPNILRAGSSTPESDIATIETELILADLVTLEKRLESERRASRSVAGGSKVLPVYERLYAHLGEGHPARTLGLSEDESQMVSDLHLITFKPVLYVFNVSEDAVAQQGVSGDLPEGIAVSARLEEELAMLSPEDRVDFMESIGLKESGLSKVIRAGYALLGLQTFFTYGPKELRAWTIRVGTLAPQAGGKIHSDFERGFIAARVIPVETLLAVGGWKNGREKGSIRTEGKDYVIQDGDVVEFRFSV